MYWHLAVVVDERAAAAAAAAAVLPWPVVGVSQQACLHS